MDWQYPPRPRYPNTFRFLRIDPEGLCQIISQDVRRGRNPVTGATSTVEAPEEWEQQVAFARMMGASAIVRVTRWKVAAHLEHFWSTRPYGVAHQWRTRAEVEAESLGADYPT